MSYDDEDGFLTKKNVGVGAKVLAGIIGVSALFSSVYTIDATENGVITTNGKIASVESSGLGFKVPFIQSVNKYPIGVQSVEITQTRPDCHSQDGAQSNAGNTTYTKDQQLVYASSKAQFSLEAGEALKTTHEKYQNYESLLQGYLAQAQKETLGNYNTVEVPSIRGKIATEIQNSLAKQVAKEGIPVKVSEVQFQNFDFSCQYEAQVEKAAEAKAELTRQETVRDTAIVNKATTITNAEAAKQEQVLAGEAEASRIRAKTSAEADGVKMMQAALSASPMIVEYTKAKNWNGALPVNMFAGAPLPLLDTTTALLSNRPTFNAGQPAATGAQPK